MDSDKAGESELLDELLGLDPRGFDEDDEHTRVFASDPPPADPTLTPPRVNRVAAARVPANLKPEPEPPTQVVVEPPTPSRVKAPRPSAAVAAPRPSNSVAARSSARASQALASRPSTKVAVAERPSGVVAAAVEQAFEEEAEVISAQAVPADEESVVTSPIAEGETDLSDEAATQVVPEVQPIERSPFEAAPVSLKENDRLIGTVIDGRYRVDSVLGVGGIGLVYLCQHEVLEKPVAIKILRQEYVLHDDLNERFLNEARASSAIKSPHIVDTIDVGSLPDGTPYFVMEYVDGETLASLLDRESSIDLFRSVEIARQIAEGLEAAHAAGVIHRDLKPENVFLSAGEAPGIPFVKIFDFGIAKVARARKRLTYAGAVFGTPHYMSPEQARGESVDTPSDIYALGVMLFEMITGTVPFDGDDPLAVMSQHVDRVPPLLSAARGVGVPASLEAVVARCLAKDPRDRYASAADLLVDLAKLDPEELRADAAMPPLPLPAMPAPPPRPRVDSAAVAGQIPRDETLHAHVVPQARSPKTHKNRMLAGGVLAASIVVGAVWWGTRADSASNPTGSTASLAAAAHGDDHAPKSEAAREAINADGSREVHFVLSPIDAHLFRDEEDLGPMPVSVVLKDSAPVTFTVRRKGYNTRRVVVDGSDTRVVIGLVPLSSTAPKPSPKATGKALSSVRRRNAN